MNKMTTLQSQLISIPTHPHTHSRTHTHTDIAFMEAEACEEGNDQPSLSLVPTQNTSGQLLELGILDASHTHTLTDIHTHTHTHTTPHTHTHMQSKHTHINTLTIWLKTSHILSCCLCCVALEWEDVMHKGCTTLSLLNAPHPNSFIRNRDSPSGEKRPGSLHTPDPIALILFS